MAIIDANDERGEYLIIPCPDGRQFTADTDDRALVEAHKWQIYSRKITPNCAYAYRAARPGIARGEFTFLNFPDQQ